jgi:hypothetical protein
MTPATRAERVADSLSVRVVCEYAAEQTAVANRPRDTRFVGLPRLSHVSRVLSGVVRPQKGGTS